MLSRKEIEFFKMALEDRKKQITSNVEIIREEDELDNEDISLLEQQTEELEEIDFAISRIKKKSYGVCEMCEEEIDIERLEVKIFARYCVTCRKIVEKVYD
jgi:DnaK suppressor protein